VTFLQIYPENGRFRAPLVLVARKKNKGNDAALFIRTTGIDPRYADANYALGGILRKRRQRFEYLNKAMLAQPAPSGFYHKQKRLF